MREDDDFPIILSGVKNIKLRNVIRPRNIICPNAFALRLSGEANDEPVVYFSLNAFVSMLNHACSRLSCEVGGFLLGSFGVDRQGEFFVVKAAVQAAAATEARTSVKFTHTSWEYLERERRCNYPQENLIGWYHTHPGYGIFYSTYDTFVQKNFFSGAKVFGVVIDPLKADLGLYQYLDEIKKRKYWQIYRDNGDLADYSLDKFD